MISECEKCEGTGAIAYEYAAHSLSESPSIGVDECPECDGEGYVCQSCGGVASSEDDDRHIDCNDGDRERRDKGNAAGGTITLPGVDREPEVVEWMWGPDLGSAGKVKTVQLGNLYCTEWGGMIQCLPISYVEDAPLSLIAAESPSPE